jgi:hypothetical protein
MLADAQFALSLSSAKTAEEVNRLVAAFKAQKAAQEDLAKTQDPLGHLKDKFSEVEDKINKFFSLAQEEIETRFARRILAGERAVEAAQQEVEAAQKNISIIQDKIDGIQSKIDEKQREIEKNITRPIEALQETISAIEDTIKANFDKPISVLQEESSDLANDLTLLDRAADAINKKYDLQEQALTKISDINKDLIAQEKQRISLADTLTSGDISAAAQAVQDMRQAASEAASSSNMDLVKGAREQELANQKTPSGLTRLQIEERQFQISQSIFNLEEGREVLESQIADIKEFKILPLEREREKILKVIRGYEDDIYDITNGELRLAREKLEAANKNLDKKKEELLLIEKERQKELDHLEDLKLEWIDVKNKIAAAELKTINLQDQIKEATRLAKLLAAEFAKIAVPGGGVPAVSAVSTPTPATATAAANAAADSSDAATKKAEEELAAQLTANAAADAEAAKTKAALAKAVADVNAAIAAAAKSGDPASKAVISAQKAESDRLAALAKQDAQNAAKAAGYATRGVQYYSYGGMVKPKNFSSGGLAKGTDTVPAMLTPGEFVVNKNATKKFGPLLSSLNRGQYPGAMSQGNFGISANSQSFISPSYSVASPTTISAPTTNVSAPSYNNNSNTVYNYSVGINVGGSNVNPDSIAKAVLGEIKYIDSQRIRGQR